jgi:acetolactate synthase-1/2/3 large subunit
VGAPVTTPHRIADLVALAIRKALSGRPGPVYLELPIDVLFRPVAEDEVPPRGSAIVPDRPAPSPSAAVETTSALRAAQRPAIVVGGGALFSGCPDELARFAERAGIPVFANNRAFGLLAREPRCNASGVELLSIMAMAGRPLPDTVMLLGARTGLLTLGRAQPMIPDEAQLIQVDLEASELGRLRPVQVPGRRRLPRAPDRPARRRRAVARALGLAR